MKGLLHRKKGSPHQSFDCHCGMLKAAIHGLDFVMYSEILNKKDIGNVLKVDEMELPH